MEGYNGRHGPYSNTCRYVGVPPPRPQIPGRYGFEGFDNEALDIKQLEDFIINDADSIFLDESVAPGSYGLTGGNGRASMDGGGLRVQQTQLPPTATVTAASTTTGPPQYLPQGVLQDPTDPQSMLNSLHQNATYCPLPDSPPDSGSEPYSPPDGSHQTDACNVKASIVNSMSLPQQMYPPPAHHGPPAHTSMSPPQHPSPPNGQAVPAHTAPKTTYGNYGTGEPPKLNHPPTSVPQQTLNSQLPPHMMPYGYGQQTDNLNNAPNQSNKKRKFSESPNNTITPGVINGMGGVNGILNNIKQEPGLLDCDDDMSYDMSDTCGMFLDGSYQVIKWQAYQPTKWAPLLDVSLKELPAPSYRVDADKGFNFSVPDEAFVCQKKNHFQVTVHIGLAGDPKYVKTPDGPKPIDSYYIHFRGCKMESQSQYIKIEQSQSDRSKKAFYPVRVDLPLDQVTKLTVGRLHFSETTTNNMRKKGKPNPDQRYFMLVVALHAHSGSSDYVIASHVSERIIVRASNPGQFDSDVDVLWQKGHTPDSVYHAGRVGVNTDRPDEALTVHGNMRLTGHLTQPSDKRAKKDITELDPKEQLKNVSKLKVYKYEYEENFAEHAGLSEDELEDTGVLAQEVKNVLPDAVQETGDLVLPNGDRIDNFLVVNKDRIYMENVGAVKELCKLTDNLENRIDELERMNKKLTKLKRMDSVKSIGSTKSLSTISTISRTPSVLASKKSHPKKNPRHPHGTPEDANLCSNKFIQITVVVLVLVMAFCLVSITTLYILEKQKSGIDDQPDVVEETAMPGWHFTSTNPSHGTDGKSAHVPRQQSSHNPILEISTPAFHTTPVPTSKFDPSGQSGFTGAVGPTGPARQPPGIPKTSEPAGHGVNPGQGTQVSGPEGTPGVADHGEGNTDTGRTGVAGPPGLSALSPPESPDSPPSGPSGSPGSPPSGPSGSPGLPTFGPPDSSAGLHDRDDIPPPFIPGRIRGPGVPGSRGERGRPGAHGPRGERGPSGHPGIEPTRTPRGPAITGPDAGDSGSPMTDVSVRHDHGPRLDVGSGHGGFIPQGPVGMDDDRHHVIDRHDADSDLTEMGDHEEVIGPFDKSKLLRPPSGSDKNPYDNRTSTMFPPNGTEAVNWTETTNSEDIPSPTPVDIGPHASPTPLTPPRCLRDSDACRTFCCPARMEDPGQDTPGIINNDVPGSHAGRSSAVNDYPDGFPPYDSGHPQDTFPIPTPKPAKSSSEVEDAPNEALDDPFQQPTLHTLDDPKIQLRVGGDSAGYGIHHRRRRAAHDESTNSAARQKAILRFQQTNRTIGDSLCTNDACRNSNGGNYTYGIPVSQYFPTGFVTMEFMVLSGEMVSLCVGREQMESLCPMTSDNSFTDSNQGGIHTLPAGHNTWDLPVGYYFNSYFRFRVAESTMTSNVCLLPPAEVGQSFDEYNLHFYRVCDGVHFS